MSANRPSFHTRFVHCLGRTGWLYLAAALPWIVLFVVLRTALHSDLLVRPTDAVPLCGALLACTHRHGSIRRTRATHPPGI